MKPSDSLHPHLQDPGDTAGPIRTQRPAAAPERKKARGRTFSNLQLLAWTMANWGYQVPDGGAYRAEAMDLYREDLHERIALLFAELDAQNAVIENTLGTARTGVSTTE